MSKRLNYNDDLEKILTAVFGIVGIIAIFINLHIKGYNAENLFDAIKDIAGLIVAIAVFLVANKVLHFNLKNKKYGFNDKFEEYLVDWAKLNKYLIDASEIKIPKGNGEKRTIQMICNHSNIVNCNDASLTSSRKGSFLYLPKIEDFGTTKGNILEFKINKSMFEGNNEVFDNYDDKKKQKASEIANAIKIEFANLSVESKDDRIIVDFSKLVKTEENAKKLIDVVEFVKTIFLAIA